LFPSAHGALSALNEANGGLQVDPTRMRANNDALGGLLFAEAVAGYLAGFIGRPAAHAMLEELSRTAVASDAFRRQFRSAPSGRPGALADAVRPGLSGVN
jgi:adenylosuccinate lyase